MLARRAGCWGCGGGNGGAETFEVRRMKCVKDVGTVLGSLPQVCVPGPSCGFEGLTDLCKVVLPVKEALEAREVEETGQRFLNDLTLPEAVSGVVDEVHDALDATVVGQNLLKVVCLRQGQCRA